MAGSIVVPRYVMVKRNGDAMSGYNQALVLRSDRVDYSVSKGGARVWVALIIFGLLVGGLLSLVSDNEMSKYANVLDVDGDGDLDNVDDDDFDDSLHEDSASKSAHKLEEREPSKLRRGGGPIGAPDKGARWGTDEEDNGSDDGESDFDIEKQVEESGEEEEEQEPEEGVEGEDDEEEDVILQRVSKKHHRKRKLNKEDVDEVIDLHQEKTSDDYTEDQDDVSDRRQDSPDDHDADEDNRLGDNGKDQKQRVRRKGLRKRKLEPDEKVPVSEIPKSRGDKPQLRFVYKKGGAAAETTAIARRSVSTEHTTIRYVRKKGKRLDK